jgi:hypothetical protein
MKNIVLTKEALDAIRSVSIGGFRDNSVRRADGLYEAPFAEDTFERMDQIRLEGESDSDVILRLVAFHKSSGKAQ